MGEVRLQLLALPLALGCSSASDVALRCGEGTHAVDGVCLPVQAAEDKATPRSSEKTTNSLGMKFVEIVPGEFTMGVASNPLIQAYEVTLTRKILFQDAEVTQEQWTQLMGKNISRKRPDLCGSCPVDSVRWVDAIIFANQLSYKEGLKPAYVQTNQLSRQVYTFKEDLKEPYVTRYSDPDIEWGWDQTANGYRLPTEAEWEYAALAGRSPEEMWVIDRSQIGWTAQNSGGLVYSARLKNPNPWGIYDLLGNVKEWCWDKYDLYPEGPVTDPQGPIATSGRGHILRGRAFKEQAASNWVKNREKGDGTRPRVQEGFRLVRNIE